VRSSGIVAAHVFLTFFKKEILIMATSNILKLVAGMFNGAPGGAILGDLSGAVNAGMSLPELADILENTNQFQSLVGDLDTAGQVEFLMNNFGLTPNGEAGTPAARAQNFFTNSINDGVGLGQMVYQALVFLESDNLPEEFAEVAALMNNKALVAEVHAANYQTIANVAAGQALFVGVTSTFPMTQAEALQHVQDIVGPGNGEEPTPLAQALETLKAAQAAVDEFLVDVLDNETFLDQFNTAAQDVMLSAGTAADADIAAALTKATGSLDVEVTARTAVNPGDFIAAGNNTREGLIADALAAAQKDVEDAAEDVAAANAELATGVRGALTTAEAARVSLEGALEAAKEAAATLAEELAVFGVLNAGQLANGAFEVGTLSAGGTNFTAGSAGDVFADASGGGTTFTVIAAINADGQWELDAGIDPADYNREGDLLADLQANTDAAAAAASADTALKAAVLQVVRLENGDNTIGADDLAPAIIDVADTDVTLNYAAGGGDNAPEAQTYLDKVAALEAAQEAQTELTDAVAAYRAMIELNDDYDALVDARDDARAAIEDSEEDGGLGINLIDLDVDKVGVDEDAELFLFDGTAAQITNFGEEDLIFFGNDYTFVGLTEDQTINNRVGDAAVLEIFWKVVGGNVELYVEQDSAAGRATNDNEITTITLVGITDDVAFEGGFVAIA
jgi:hypothetical protein